MLGIAWSEMLLTAAVAVVVIGPKDLPGVLYSAGKILRKIKIFTSDIQKSLDQILHDEEMKEIIREANKAGGDNLDFEIEQQRAIEERRKKSEAAQSVDDGGGHDGK